MFLSANASPAADLVSLLSVVAANPATQTVLNAQVMSTAAPSASVDTQSTSEARHAFLILNAPTVKLSVMDHVLAFALKISSSSKIDAYMEDVMKDMLLTNSEDA